MKNAEGSFPLWPRFIFATGKVEVNTRLFIYLFIATGKMQEEANGTVIVLIQINTRSKIF
jgi:hypothetical protein